TIQAAARRLRRGKKAICFPSKAGESPGCGRHLRQCAGLTLSVVHLRGTAKDSRRWQTRSVKPGSLLRKAQEAPAERFAPRLRAAARLEAPAPARKIPFTPSAIELRWIQARLALAESPLLFGGGRL